MYDIQCIAPTVASILAVPVSSGSEVGPVEKVTDSMQPPDRLALVVLDGLGSNVLEQVKDEMPVLMKLADLHHIEVRSVLPSLTYICLSTLPTGTFSVLTRYC
ncbi:MAG: hypothetical protein CME25_14725 [Gemmatimonadetes bacterium]|nr:hypothetical protein [Gemmatimonadota bacterium]|tara:strand:+ start:194 stop:502 length:309 start_codon:yes stop_codon:yes gene_type:complete